MLPARSATPLPGSTRPPAGCCRKAATALEKPLSKAGAPVDQDGGDFSTLRGVKLRWSWRSCVRASVAPEARLVRLWCESAPLDDRNGPLGEGCVGFTWHIRARPASGADGGPRICAGLPPPDRADSRARPVKSAHRRVSGRRQPVEVYSCRAVARRPAGRGLGRPGKPQPTRFSFTAVP